MDNNEKELIALCKNGDKQAFKVLVDRYQKKAFMIAFGVVGNYDDAMDVCQDAFIKAFKAISSFEADSSFFTWFYKIVVNQSIDFQRKEKRHIAGEYIEETIEDDVPDYHIDNYKYNPATEFEKKELQSLLENGLEKLSPEHRAVIVFREVEGLSYKEISDIMETSEGTVMSRLFYARKKLQEFLTPYYKGV